MIRESNRNIRQDRRFLLTLRDDLRTVMSLNDKELSRFDRLSQRYRVKPADSLLDQVNALLVKVDVVPESLVLAQSANESGWGTSRFARQANNMFGVWCWSPGCGLKPLQRTEGLTHEVARYATVQDSVNAYIHTINTNPAYADLRDIRAAHRAGDEIMSGLALAEGLIRYSERGMDYVREIQQMIRVNNLHEYNFS
jgi:Bax protein